MSFEVGVGVLLVWYVVWCRVGDFIFFFGIILVNFLIGIIVNGF